MDSKEPEVVDVTEVLNSMALIFRQGTGSIGITNHTI